MCHDVVHLMDAVAAVTVIEMSMQGAALLGSMSPLHSAFPEDADTEYAHQERLVLARLGLSHLQDSADAPAPGNPGATAPSQPRASHPPTSQACSVMSDLGILPCHERDLSPAARPARHKSMTGHRLQVGGSASFLAPNTLLIQRLESTILRRGP
eukprot:m.115605 g.115605  ORF g.115605 m.115605 type:complete len:155 (+) comp51922_c0_seq2:1862-2326(+)